MSDLKPERLNKWLFELQCSEITRSNFRRQALTICREALGEKFPDFSSRIRRVKVPRKIPVAWSMDELRQLIQTAAKLPGKFNGSKCPAKLYFTAWILLAWETGLRWGDQWELRASQLRGDRLFVIQSKTKNPIGKRLSLQCVELLAQMIRLSPDGTVFKWAINERNARVRWKKLIARAGLIGTPKFLRRSGATYVEAQQPGAASVFLGHRSAELAEKNYIDPTLLPDRSPRPPSLFPLSRSTADFPAYETHASPAIS